jgi:hypothetical protein
MKAHKRIMHEVSKFLCIYCPYIAETQFDLEKHKGNLHAEEILHKPSPMKNHEQKRREKEKEMDFSCDECGKKLQSRQGLRFHKDAEHRGIRFPCPVAGCDFTAKQRGSLVTHTKCIHIEHTHHCDICDFSAGTAALLRRHKASKHKISVPIFACDKCGMRSNDPEKARKHLLTMHN